MADTTARRRGPGAMQDVDRHVARRMRERRLTLGLTLQQVAARIGTTEQQMSKYEKGTNRIAVGRLYLIARALEVEPGYFFGGLGAEPTTEPWQRMMLELARDFAHLPSRQHKEAIAELARALTEP